jgi:anaerobic magnesium-protoporphyrin IX monomethyl ester cyclase
MKKHHIKPCFFLQFGYLGETKEDIDKTLDMLLTLMPYDIGISVSYPLPGTKFYELVKNDLTKKQNWNDSDELLMMFHSTYSAKYYKQLHRYVHKRFRRAQGIENIKKIFSAKTHLTKTELRRIISLPYFIPMSYWNKWKLNSIVKQ